MRRGKRIGLHTSLRRGKRIGLHTSQDTDVMGRKGKQTTPSPAPRMKTRAHPDTPVAAETTPTGGEPLVDPPTPVVQQLADDFEGVVDQGVAEFSNLASAIGAQSEEEILAAEELEEFNECKEDPLVAPIPDPSEEEMRAFGIQITGEEPTEDLEQVDDSSAGSTASVFQTAEFLRWERRKDKRDAQQRQEELTAALQLNNEQNNATLLSQLSALISSQLTPVQQSLAITQQKVDDLQTAHTAIQRTLASTVEAEVKRQMEQSTVITQTLRGDLLAATEASHQQQQTMTQAMHQAKEAGAQLKVATTKYNEAAKALQDYTQSKAQQLKSMEAQIKEWQKSASQLDAVKKKTGTLQQIQQGIESSQTALNETRDQVEGLIKAARDLQAHQPQSVGDQAAADINAANAKTVADWVKFQKDFLDFKKEYALEVKESKAMISRLDEIITELEHSAQMVKGKGAASLVVSRATKATLNSMLDDKLKQFTKEYIENCASKRMEPILQRDLGLLETRMTKEIKRIDKKFVGPEDIETQYKQLLRRLEVIEKAGLIDRMGHLEKGYFQQLQEILEHGFEDGSEHPFVTRLRMLEVWKSQLETNGIKIDWQPFEDCMRRRKDYALHP